MSSVIARSVEDPGRFGRLCGLPACGRGNGLDDDAWAPVLPHLARELDGRGDRAWR